MRKRFSAQFHGDVVVSGKELILSGKKGMANLGLWRAAMAVAMMTGSPGHPPDRNVAVYLTSSSPEAVGYHHYHYFLLRPPKDAAERERLERVLSAEKRRLLTKVTGKDPGTDVFYFLVLEPPAEHFDAAWLVDHYDYARAERLRRFLGVAPEAGQVVAQSERPLLNAPKEDRATVQISKLTLPSPVAVDVPTRGGPPPEFTGREFLSRQDREVEGYGLYSYVLMGERLNDSNRALYEAVVSAYLDLGEVRRFETEQHVTKQQLNVTYMPLREQAAGDVSAEWVLAHYDYVAAEVLARKLMERPNPAGVYVVSYFQPVTQANAIDRQKLLVQDLTGVPADLAFLWFRQFQEQARQGRYWDDRTVGQFMLKMRTQIAEIAGAFGATRTGDADAKVFIAAKIHMAQ